MSRWFDCVKEPAELGKKVLCFHKGDVYVAMRFEDLYIPWPFATWELSMELTKPEKWCEIPFPEGYTGHLRVSLTGKTKDALTLEELKLVNEKSYFEFIKPIIESIGSGQFE